VKAPRRRKPLTTSPISEAAKFADARRAALSPLNGDSRLTEFDGVTINLNHPELSPLTWELQGQFGTSNYSGPILWFPSDPTPPKVHFPLVTLRQGDLVQITDVTLESVGRGLDDSFDFQRRIAKLQVIRPGVKSPIPLRGRLILRSPHALLVGGRSGRQTGGVTISRIGARLEAMTTLAAIRETQQPDSDDFTEAARQALTRQAEAVLQGDINEASNAAAAAGYFLARAEDQMHPAVDRGFKSLRQLRDASAKGGKKRAEGKSAVWIPRAKEIWSQHLDYTVNRVAELIAEETGADIRSISRAIKTFKPNV
jgi:hypothetical protein